jgi:hypothetical protein
MPAGRAAVLTAATVELEQFVADAGWDQPARLFALASTAALAQAEPALAEALGLDPDDADGLTPVEQDSFPAEDGLDEALARIAWPNDVVGAAVVVERLVLPPEAEASLHDTTDPEALAEAAAAHPEAREVRMAVSVMRDGTRICTLRVRGADPSMPDGDAVVSGPDLVPGLAEALAATFG